MMSNCENHLKNQQQGELCSPRQPLSPRDEYLFPFLIHSLMRSKLQPARASSTFASTCLLQVTRSAQLKVALWLISIRCSLKGFIDTDPSRNLSANWKRL